METSQREAWCLPVAPACSVRAGQAPRGPSVQVPVMPGPWRPERSLRTVVGGHREAGRRVACPPPAFFPEPCSLRAPCLAHGPSALQRSPLGHCWKWECGCGVNIPSFLPFYCQTLHTWSSSFARAPPSHPEALCRPRGQPFPEWPPRHPSCQI